MNHRKLNKLFCYCVCLILFILFSSCKDVSDPIAHFRDVTAERITPSRIINIEDFGLLKPADVILRDNDFIIWDAKNKDIFNILNYYTEELLIKGVNKGNGPYEI